MDSDGKFWLSIWAIVLSVILVGAVMLTIISTKHTEKMASLGYEEVMVIGSTSTVWHKVR